MNVPPPPLPGSARRSSGCRRMGCLAVALAVIGFVAYQGYSAYQLLQRATPFPTTQQHGHAELNRAEKLIISNKGTVGHGNTPQAKELAETFAKEMKILRESFFTKGRTGTFSLTGGEFITYCNLIGEEKCVFLVHVPQLRKFDAEAKNSLVELAWFCASSAVEEAGLPDTMELAVGVKGILMYEGVWTGVPDGDGGPLSGVKFREKGVVKPARLYPFFAEKTAKPSPVPPAVERASP